MTNDDLDKLLLEDFERLELKKPLFYNAPVGIRFEMGGDIDDLKQRVKQAEQRAVTLFNSINSYNSDIYNRYECILLVSR